MKKNNEGLHMPLPRATVGRLVVYLQVLEELEADGQQQVSSSELAEHAQVTGFQVRKDLSYLGRLGVRGRGYGVAVLRRQLIQLLGLSRPWRVAVVGMGRLGRAVAGYPLAAEYRFEYVGFFDTDPDVQGSVVGGLPVRALTDLPALVNTVGVDMAFLTVPPEEAQRAAEYLVECGICSILNFAPVTLRPPQKGEVDDGYPEAWHNVTIEHVDLLAGMKRLAYYTSKNMEE